MQCSQSMFPRPDRQTRSIFDQVLFASLMSLLVGALVGCAPIGPNYFEADPQTVTEAVEIVDDPYKTLLTYVGPMVNFRNGDLNMGTAIRGWRVRQSREVTHQLFIFVIYRDSDLRRYRRATYLGGSVAEVTDIDWEVLNCLGSRGQCSYSETFGVSLSDDFLRDQAERGFSIQITARSGHSFLATVPNGYLRGYLNAVGDS